MPGLSATNAITYVAWFSTFSESVHHGLPLAGTPSRDSTTAWWPCRCIGCTSPLSLLIVMRTTSPSATWNIGTSGKSLPLIVHQKPGLP